MKRDFGNKPLRRNDKIVHFLFRKGSDWFLIFRLFEFFSNIGFSASDFFYFPTLLEYLAELM